MAYFSDDLIEEVRSRNDIVDVISGYVQLKKKGSTYFGLCPFHNEKTASFSVTPSRQMYYCYGCGAGGSVFSFLMQYENLTFPEAVETLAERAGMQLPKQEPSEEKRRQEDLKTRLLAANKEAALYYVRQLDSPRGEQARTYLANRQLSQQTIRRFGLGYADRYGNGLYRALKEQGFSDEELKKSGLLVFDEEKGFRDRFWSRVMFPIMDERNRVIAFGGRVMGEGEPKYLNSPETDLFHKSDTLYGLNYARSSRRHGLLLCEGYMDVIALHQAGFDNAVAALGTAFTPGHARKLARYAGKSGEVYLTFDSDGAGRRAALRAIPILRDAGLLAKVVHMDPHKDPDEFIKAQGAEAYRQRLEQAENSFLFEIRMLEQEYDLSDPEGKTAFFRQTASRLTQFSEALERENYIEAIARRYRVSADQLKELVRSEAAKEGLAAGRDRQSAAQNPRVNVHVESGRKPKPEDGIRKSQQLLLTWMCDDPKLYGVISEYVAPEDFDGELYQTTARALYGQLAAGKANPAAILNLFPEEESQREVAQIFHARIPLPDSEREQEKAVRETVLRVKRASVERRSRELDPADLAGLQKLIEERKALSKIGALRLS